ncbi:MAG TPA: methyltransferase domain-containing protein [Methanospirillum sp.]|uniref:class I SAM-dependent methyltransferase n=1 Tax=Methanospirillum sp. TaxID=45200 RepID=UPI002CD2C4C7|nr:methyltransferase domain-containing protein [Methanospirillum sp.]HOJ97227.1 methyltransferase domain-containing protein [Methanospirillum sp.]HOL42235.1 methyltransferase domain-containing protein [Methanospirillum sp.]HPP78085.1 methyltransferase domain-containing protein [Methanospirillum sp.]
MAHSVCPADRAWMLDNPLRSLLIRPKRLLKPYIRPGMTVLDVGCGPGFFTRVLADLVGPTGQVIAADLQQEMLTMTGSRMTRKGVSDRVLLHKTSAESLQLQMSETVDFAIAFHVVHEVPSPYTLFSEVFDCSKPGGLFLVSEPNGHVNRTEFDQEMKDALAAGFIIAREQHSRWEHQVILQKV